MEENVTAYERARQLLEEKGVLTQDMIIKLGVGHSGANWILKKLMREKIIVEGDGYGLYFPYRELNFDEIVNILQKKKMLNNVKEILEILNDLDRPVRPHEIYEKTGKSPGWFGWNIIRCINFGLVEMLHKGLYAITDKGRELLKILKSS